MNLTNKEMVILGYFAKHSEKTISPENIKTRFGPETLEFTLTTLQAKGLIQHVAGGYTPTEKGQELMKKKKTITDTVTARGHPNILSTHNTTLEITKDADVTKNGDCIIAVGADKGCADLKTDLKDALKVSKKVEITISAGGKSDVVEAYGSPALNPIDENDIVIRKSDYIDERTLAILANKAASDLKKDLVQQLKKEKNEVKVSFKIVV